MRPETPFSSPFSGVVVALVVALASDGCSARSALPGGGGAGAVSTTSSGDTGGGGGAASVPFACDASIVATTPFAIDVDGGTPGRASLVFGTNDGGVVSVFHGWSKSATADTSEELHVTTLEPFGAWPPVPGAHFTALAESGDAFAVDNAAWGTIELLVHQSDPQNGPGLMLTSPVSATSPGYLLGVTLAFDPTLAKAAFLVRGYDTPPIAYNDGYLAMLAAYETRDPATTERALRLAVASSGADILGGAVQRPDDPDLACARGPIASAAVRAGKSWLVVAGAGADLQICEGNKSGPPSTLVVDRLAWGAPDAVDWTLERTDAKKGAEVVERVRMAEALDGAFALASRAGHPSPDLFVVSNEGKLGEPIATDAPNGEVTDMAMAPLATGVLVAYVDAGAPRHVRLEARDRRGAVRARGSVDASGDVSGLTTLASKKGDAVLLGWTSSSEAGPKIELSRVDCGGGS